jgi:hypothetical protein
MDSGKESKLVITGTAWCLLDFPPAVLLGAWLYPEV